MASVFKRPVGLSAAIKQFSRPSSILRTTRGFQTCAPESKPVTQSSVKPQATFQHAFRRAYQTQGYQYNPAQTGSLTQRLLYGGLMVGGAVVAANLIFNRETREDGGMPTYEREYLNQTFMHTGLGIGIIGMAARVLHTSGWSYRLMATSPWVVVIGGLAASIGTMYGTLYTHPDK